MYQVAAQNALQRWLDQQRLSRQQFTAAEEPLRQAVEMFQPGGGYGRGQATLLREEARRAQAEATAQQVASGMSSGSLATGTKLRTERDLATGLAGVEDVRTQFLQQALANLSGLRGQQAGLTAQVTDPIAVPYLNYLSNRYGQVSDLNRQTIGVGQQTTTRPATVGAFGQTRVSPSKFTIPRYR